MHIINLTVNENIFYMHTIFIAEAMDSGKIYSWRLNRGDGSQSIIILPNFSLYSTGHTKYGYWQRKYDI